MRGVSGRLYTVGAGSVVRRLEWWWHHGEVFGIVDLEATCAPSPMLDPKGGVPSPIICAVRFTAAGHAYATLASSLIEGFTAAGHAYATLASSVIEGFDSTVDRWCEGLVWGV